MSFCSHLISALKIKIKITVRWRRHGSVDISCSDIDCQMFFVFFNDSDDLMAVQIVGLKITDIYFGAVGHIQSTRSFGIKFCCSLRC